MSDDKRRRGNSNAALITVGVITLVDVLVASASTVQTTRPSKTRDYSDRVGFPGGVEAARGALANYTARDYKVTPRLGGDELLTPNADAH